MKTFKVLLRCFVLGVFGASTLMAQAQVHSHGVAEMSVVFSVKEKQLQIALEIPLESLVGFERKPRNEKESQKLKAALELLKSPVAMAIQSEKVTSPSCVFSVQEPEVHFGEKKGKGEKQSKKEISESHAEIEVKYAAKCEAIESVQSLEVKLFDSFKSLTSIKGQLVTDTGSKAIMLNKKSAILNLEIAKE